jgi:hypothetical protein
MAKKKEETKGSGIFLRLDPEVEERIRTGAKEEKRTISNYINYLLFKALENKK